ncbi:MAG TPA: hypothetical protein EYF98_16345 [Planctomycetes bacterium]|nr:hypothetical protein [Planctomycetota bacterium]
MSDLTCVVCGEPWDAWGVRHGDMLRWHASLFLKGAGCPSCEGVSPYPKHGPMENLAGLEHPEEAFLRDRILINPDRDGSHELLVRVEQDGSNDNRPPWVIPQLLPLWQCSGCSVRVVYDFESDYPDGQVDGVVNNNLMWSGGDMTHYGGFRSYTYGEHHSHEGPTTESHGVVANEDYCPGCVELCPDCTQTWIFTRSDMVEDVYDEGGSFLIDGDTNRARSVCLACLEEHTNNGKWE